MCVDIPIWLTTALTLAGTAVSAGSALAQGSAQASAANEAAAVADQNAASERARSAEEATRQRRAGQLQLARGRAGLGASGVTSEGSPADVLAQNAAEIELDAQTILYGGATRANALETEASRYRRQARTASTASIAQAGTSLLLGFGSELAAERRARARYGTAA